MAGLLACSLCIEEESQIGGSFGCAQILEGECDGCMALLWKSSVWRVNVNLRE